jgi:hypothetical protein
MVALAGQVGSSPQCDGAEAEFVHPRMPSRSRQCRYRAAHSVLLAGPRIRISEAGHSDAGVAANEFLPRCLIVRVGLGVPA